MDTFTYGNSPAAVTLAKIVTEKYPRLTRKLGKYLCEMNRCLFLLASCHSRFKYDMGMLETLLLQCRDFHLNRIRTCKTIPDEVKTYALNVASKNGKVWSKVVKDYKTQYLNEQRKDHPKSN
jgi:hypothetical protein